MAQNQTIKNQDSTPTDLEFDPNFKPTSSLSRPVTGNLARNKRCKWLLKQLASSERSVRILEIGCGDSWLGSELSKHGFYNYVGLDLFPPAPIVGSITDWRELGLPAEGFDVIIAFEVLEHIDITNEVLELLVPGGIFILTTPVPHMDWACKLLELIGINQKRTSSHCNLTYVRSLRPRFELLNLDTPMGIGQWAVMKKPKLSTSPQEQTPLSQVANASSSVFSKR